jgi:iron complex outermembrane recepter protein
MNPRVKVGALSTDELKMTIKTRRRCAPAAFASLIAGWPLSTTTPALAQGDTPAAASEPVAAPEPIAVEPSGGGSGAPAASAAPDEASRNLTAVVVTGTRRTTRTVFDSSAPMDVVTSDELQTVPSGDVNDKLAQTIPSFNVQRLPLFDGAIFNRPATLRGLSPDQTLVLINGKRRHRSAYIDVTAAGAQAVDLSEIPLAAIERIEVLRDGASAQYGSDAIAGVINIILKNAPGTSGYLQGSQYYEGDGANFLGGTSLGWGLGGKGTLNLSLELSAGRYTSRSNQRPNAAALLAAGNAAVRQPVVQRFGQPDTRAAVLFVNAEYELGKSLEAYAFGSAGYHWGENDFNYRNPTQGSVFTSTQPPEVFDANFATLPPAYQDWYNGNPAALSGFPGGFTPRFSATALDASAVAGLRGDITSDLLWDLSARYGTDYIEYHIRDTLNASLGPESPHAFDTGTKQQTELGANLDFNYSLAAGLAQPINVAFGGEARREVYELGTGDGASYSIGPAGVIGLAGGANGFFGTGPNQAGSWGRNSVAGYVDVDADITRRFNLGAAGRAENYSDAGSTVNYKLSSRLGVLEQLNLRGAISTGFRAPTPGQANLTNTNQNPAPDGLSIQTNGTIPPENPISALKGGTALEPEKSFNISLGFVAQPLAKLTFSADVYRIEIKDRIGLSQRYTLTPDEQQGLLDSGVTEAQGLTSFNFFVNGYATRTQGLDVVLAYAIPLGGDSTLNATYALNVNETEVQSFSAGVIDARQRQYIEDRLPKLASTLALEYVNGPASLLARAREYGSWTEPLDQTTDDAGNLVFNQKFGPEIFFDLSAGYNVTEHWRLSVGAENLFNNYPDKARFPNTLEAAAARAVPSNGRVYPSQRPYEADGGRYYARVTFDY